MQVDIRADVARASKYLRGLQRKQIPFATSKALNDTAWDAREHLQLGMRRDLDRPTKFTQGGVRVQRSTKRRLRAAVYLTDIAEGYLRWQIWGGRRMPKNRVIIVGQGRRNQYGNTPGFRRLRSRLLAQKNTFEGNVRGVAGIWRRRKSGLELLALYVSHADYRKRFRFFERGQKAIRARFPTNFARAMRRALATAR